MGEVIDFKKFQTKKINKDEKKVYRTLKKGETPYNQESHGDKSNLFSFLNLWKYISE